MNTVLEGCTLAVKAGQTVVLTGVNGAGKSTLKTAAGLLPMEQGHVEHGRWSVPICDVDDDLLRWADPSAKRRVGSERLANTSTANNERTWRGH